MSFCAASFVRWGSDMTCIEITFPWLVNGLCVAELEARVTFDFTPGTKDYFCKSFGNWLPGDDPLVEIERIELIEIGVPEPSLVPCPEFLVEDIAKYAEEHHMAAMIENGMEDAYDRQQGDW